MAGDITWVDKNFNLVDEASAKWGIYVDENGNKIFLLPRKDAAKSFPFCDECSAAKACKHPTQGADGKFTGCEKGGGAAFYKGSTPEEAEQEAKQAGEVTYQKFLELKEAEKSGDAEAIAKAKAAHEEAQFKSRELRAKANTMLDPSRHTEDELAAVGDYANGGHRNVNFYLRHGKFHDDAEKEDKADARNTIKEMDSAIKKQYIISPVTVYRGADLSPEVLAQMKSGSVIVDKGFVSTSFNKETADKFAGNTVFEIRVPKDTRALYLGNNVGGKKEDEFVLGRNTKFKVVNVEQRGERFVASVEVVKK